MSNHHQKFYIGGAWVDPLIPATLDVINPATEQVIGQISLGNSAEVDGAVAAANKAFATYSETNVRDRIALLRKIIEVYKSKSEEMAQTICSEMGAPLTWIAQ